MELKKKNILFIGPYPPPYSGPDIAMKTLLESSLSKRFRIKFINTNFRKSNAERGRIDIPATIAMLRFLSRLTKRFADRQIHLVYYFVTATISGWITRDVWCILLSRLFVGKIVIHMRAGHFRRNYENAPFLCRKLIRLACSCVSLGFVQARVLRDQFNGLLHDDRIISVYNTVDTRVYSNSRLHTYNHLNIFFMGHLSHAKGYCDVLKVIPMIAEKHPGVRFVFAGTKLEKEKNIFFNQITGKQLKNEDPDEVFSKYIAGRYEENYCYMGSVKGRHKLDLFEKSSIFLLPTYSEGFSMAVLEAMAMSKPVVCTPVGAHCEVIEDGVNGFLVQPGDLDTLTDRILRLIENETLRKRIGETNRRYVETVFEVEIIARRIGDYFETVIDGNKR